MAADRKWDDEAVPNGAPRLAVIRFNAEMKARYHALNTAGKPPKLAHSHHAKEHHIANTLLREQRLWIPQAA